MFSKEKIHHLSVESHMCSNGYLIVTTKDCPLKIAEEMKARTTEKGEAWFLNQPHHMYHQPRRKIYRPALNSEQTPAMVLKQKNVVAHDAATFDHRAFFTDSLIHEMRTAYALRKVLNSPLLPQEIDYFGRQIKLIYQVQSPWGAIINTRDPNLRFGCFEYRPGISVREKITMYGSWNETPELERKLFGQIQLITEQIAQVALQAGIETNDLGAHQIIYRYDEVSDALELNVLDTEEYNLTSIFKGNWNKEDKVFLPPVIWAIGLFIDQNAFD